MHKGEGFPLHYSLHCLTDRTSPHDYEHIFLCDKCFRFNGYNTKCFPIKIFAFLHEQGLFSSVNVMLVSVS